MTSYTINVTYDPSVPVHPALIKAMERYKRPDDDGDGSAGVAAMVPAIPPRDSGGMYVDAP